MYIVIIKEAVPIKNNNTIASAIVITAATTIIAAYCFFFPENAKTTLLIYISTIIFMSVILGLISWLYKKTRTSVNDTDIAKIIEALNTEMIVWTDDFSFVYANKLLRQHLEITDGNYDKKAVLLRAFAIKNSDNASEDEQLKIHV